MSISLTSTSTSGPFKWSPYKVTKDLALCSRPLRNILRNKLCEAIQEVENLDTRHHYSAHRELWNHFLHRSLDEVFLYYLG